MPPIVQALLTCLLIFLIVCLVFDFEEILAVTPSDASIALDEAEIDKIGNEEKEKLNMQGTLNLTLSQRLI